MPTQIPDVSFLTQLQKLIDIQIQGEQQNVNIFRGELAQAQLAWAQTTWNSYEWPNGLTKAKDTKTKDKFIAENKEPTLHNLQNSVLFHKYIPEVIYL